MTDHTLSGPEMLRDALAQRLGLHFDDSKLDYLRDVLAHRLLATGLSEMDYILALAAEAGLDELGALARELTVPETYFFRHTAQFSVLRDTALPAAIRHAAGRRPVRILSAGCASGEEAYSIAMLVRDMNIDPRSVAIRAVDINPAPLKKAREGRYSSWALRETPPELRARWFKREGNDFLISEDIRRAVSFEQHNLTDPQNGVWLPGSYDIVFCRNAIMYLTVEKMREVVALIEQALVPGGYFFLGHAETLRGLSDTFTLCQGHGSFYYRRAGEKRAAKARTGQPHHVPATAHAVADSPPVDWMEAIDKAAKQIGKLAHSVPGSHAEPMPSGTTNTIQAVQTLVSHERFSEALEQVDASLARDGSNAQLQLLRAMLLIHCGQAEAAEKAAQALLDHGDVQAGAHHVLALCREKAGDIDTACEHDRAAAYADASFAMPRLHLGLLARRAGRLAEMRRELAQAQFLLRREDPSRLALFGGGFTRQALIDLCAATLGTGEQRR